MGLLIASIPVGLLLALNTIIAYSFDNALDCEHLAHLVNYNQSFIGMSLRNPF